MAQKIVFYPTKMHLSSQEVASVVLGFPSKVSWPDIASLPRTVSIEPINSN